MRIKRLTLALPSHRRGEAEALARRAAREIARALPGAVDAPVTRRVHIAGAGQPAALLGRRIADVLATSSRSGGDGRDDGRSGNNLGEEG